MGREGAVIGGLEILELAQWLLDWSQGGGDGVVINGDGEN